MHKTHDTNFGKWEWSNNFLICVTNIRWLLTTTHNMLQLWIIQYYNPLILNLTLCGCAISLSFLIYTFSAKQIILSMTASIKTTFFFLQTFSVYLEKWKQRQQKKRGRYVSAIKRPFPFQRATKKVCSNCYSIICCTIITT